MVRGGHILAINDTTEINLHAHAGRVRAEELGVIGDGKSLGFFLHPTLVLCAQTGEALGLSSVQSWTRPETKPNKHERDYKRQAIAEKESYKWLRAAQETKAVLSEADTITMIADRESDIYEEFATVPDESLVPKDERTHLLVRCCHDRCLVDGETKLYQTLQEQELAGSYSLSLPADKRKGRKQREAKLEVRFCQVKLKRPSTLGNDYPKSVTLYAVEARECQATIAEGEEAIHWRLLSTHEVDSYEKALQLIIWYSWRFFIEQLFRTLKRQGLELEATELESGKAIIKLAIFGLHAALGSAKGNATS